MTPDDIRATILGLSREQAKGPEAHYEAELAAERAEDEYDAKYDRAFLDADGNNIEERKAQARLVTREARETAFVARAAHNRVKLKMKQLDSSVMAHMAVLKSVMAEGA
jgi:hypothetical protein